MSKVVSDYTAMFSSVDTRQIWLGGQPPTILN